MSNVLPSLRLKSYRREFLRILFGLKNDVLALHPGLDYTTDELCDALYDYQLFLVCITDNCVESSPQFNEWSRAVNMGSYVHYIIMVLEKIVIMLDRMDPDNEADAGLFNFIHHPSKCRALLEEVLIDKETSSALPSSPFAFLTPHPIR